MDSGHSIDWTLQPCEPFSVPIGLRLYRPVLTAHKNGKGCLDVDTVKGCTLGMQAYPMGGCYGECYAYKNSIRYGFDFGVSISRKLRPGSRADVFCTVRDHAAGWYRIGVAGDPSHDWENTVKVCEFLAPTRKLPVIITKHWITISDDQLRRLAAVSAVMNTSTSGMDSDHELEHRIRQIKRLHTFGITSVCRVVTCKYGHSKWARCCQKKQEYLLSLKPTIDNPLRAQRTNPHVTAGEIMLDRVDEAIGGGKLLSLHTTDVYLGACEKCADQCGTGCPVPPQQNEIENMQTELFPKTVEWVYVPTIIGSGYEKQVAELAIKDGIAKRAARKNMQIHSAIILKVNGQFAGFFTFQDNPIVGEFCLLQSVIEPLDYTQELYAEMVRRVIAQNTSRLPAIITTDPKSKFETPALFESVGFKTYLKMSGFHYMVYGDVRDVRMKLLAHITMTNVWNSIKGDWLRLKTEWRERIETAGKCVGVENPSFATREGCWQGEAGFSNVVNTKRSIGATGDIEVTTKSHNGNASVLDPVACEVIARFFMPKDGHRIYNPFGGGVQFGYVAGACGYEYLASEIRQNQCDANNRICAEFPGTKWFQSDSSTYEPDGMFDLVFTCPPYFKVERYVDYDGKPPAGEINSLDTYEKFRDALFRGYKKAIGHLNENCFFVVMTGDSRDKRGAYYCSEAETELFFKENGLSVYNKIIYLECEFTRLAQAKKTLNMRKFPKREQKIIVAFKGDPHKIKDLYAANR